MIKKVTRILTLLPLLWLSIAFQLGIVLASMLAAAFWLWLLLGFSFVLALFAFRGRLPWSYSLLLLVASVLFLGAARYQAAQPHFTKADLAFYNDRSDSVEIHGLVVKPPVPRDGYIELIVRADEISLTTEGTAEGVPVRGLLLARVDLGENNQYGDEVLVRGQLQTPPIYDEFSYRDYLARRGVYSLMHFATAQKLATGRGSPFWALLYGIRERGVNVLHRIYPDPEASLLAGILLGDESGLSDPLKSAFNDTNTRHIIAISGFNISIIAGLMLATFRRWLGIRRGIWLAILGIAFYTILVGAEASVVRAAIMGILALVARQLGRQQFSLNTLAFTAALMNLVNPFLLWDVGFQLSFAATLGLILYADPIQSRAVGWLSFHLPNDWVALLKGPLTDYVFLTLAAQITTLPLLLYHFQRFSLLSLPANLLILPAQPALMVLAGFSVLAGLIWLPAGSLSALFAWPLAAYTIRVVLAFASLAWVAQEISFFSLVFVIIYYLGLFVLTVPEIRTRLTVPRLGPAFPLAGLAIICFWVWSSAFAAPDGKLQLTLLDVGGEALLIRTPTGRTVLINGGPSGPRLAEQLGRELPIFNSKLDWVIIAGQRPEQISGLLSDLNRIPFNQIAWASSDRSQDSSELGKDLESLGFSLIQLRAGRRFDLDGAYLEVLAVGDRGATLLLRYGNFRALFPLGLDFDQLEIFKQGETIGPVGLLLLADSGYPPLNPPEWIANLAPQVVWVAAGGESLDPEMLNSLGNRALRSDELGWLLVSTDGQQIWLESEH